MKTNGILLLIALFLIMTSCSESREMELSAPVFKAQMADHIKLSDYFTALEYVILEGSRDGLFIYADKIEFFQNRWYLFDQEMMAILCFSEDGQFLFRIHHVGKGPGEYQYLTSFMINRSAKEIWTQCRISKRTLIYDLDGRFVREEKVDRVGVDLIEIKNSKVLAYDEEFHHLSLNDSVSSGVYRMEKQFGKKNQLFTLPAFRAYYELENKGNFDFYQDTCYFLSPSDSLICFPEDLKPKVVGVFDFGPNHLSGDLKNLSSKFENFTKLIESGKVLFKENLVVTDKAIFLTLGYQNSLWNGIIDRSSTRFQMTQGFVNDLSALPFAFPVGHKDDDHLVGYISADELLAYQDYIDRLSKSDRDLEFNRKLASFLEESLNQSGNVLVISKLKPKN